MHNFTTEDRTVEAARKAWNKLEGYCNESPEFFDTTDRESFLTFYLQVIEHLMPGEESTT